MGEREPRASGAHAAHRSLLDREPRQGRGDAPEPVARVRRGATDLDGDRVDHRARTRRKPGPARKRPGSAADADAEVQQIVDATYRVIERTGDVDPRIRDILAEARLSTPAFYRHFRSKDELFVHILGDGRRRLARSIERRLAREHSGMGRLRAWVATVLAQAADPVAAARTRPFVANLDRLVARYPVEHRDSEQLLVDQLQGILAGARDLHSPDPERDARTIYQLTVAILSWHLRNRTRPGPDDEDGIVDFASRALRGAPAPPGTTQGAKEALDR